jgi:hypothetical protein
MTPADAAIQHVIWTCFYMLVAIASIGTGILIHVAIEIWRERKSTKSRRGNNE